MMTKQKIIISFLSFCTLLPLNSKAWGPIAHKSVGLIAESMLTPQARQNVQQILGEQTLAGVSTWADEVRGKKTDYRQTSSYHFENVPDGMTYLESLRALSPENRQKGGAVAAISVAIALLRDPAISHQERNDALKFLVHFVGDIHQPLHSGRPEDLGGNRIAVVWFGFPTNLHAIWDSGLILAGHQDFLRQDQPYDEAAVAYARYLFATQTQYNDQIPMAIDVQGWLNESLNYRPLIYNGPYNDDQANYLASHLAFVDLRVYEAGLRLAYVLNQIYAQSPIESSEQDLWRRIQEILGPLFNLISFKP